MTVSAAPRDAARRSLWTWTFAGLRASAWGDLAVVAVLVGLAGAVRWPYLLLSPQFPSVGDSIMLALDMAEGHGFHLADSAPYLGAPFVWLLALTYRLFGPSIEVTMQLAWALGTSTVVPTYLLGRAVGGRLGGTVAGLLLATSGAHTVVTSHVALSHSLTPLVSTTALWLLARAAGRPTGADAAGRFAARSVAGRPVRAPASGGRTLALSGLLAGLALQTHPTVAPLLAGAALGALLTRRDWLTTRWTAVALAMVLVGYSSLLAYHVTSRFAVISDVASKQARYLDADVDEGEAADHGVYLNNAEQLALAVVRLVGGALADRAQASEYLHDPWIVAPAMLAVAGLAVAARRRQWWLVGGVALAIALPPAFSGKYRPVLDGRYLMPLLPVLFVAVGLAATAAARLLRAGPAGERRSFVPARAARLAGALALAIGLAALAAHPLALLGDFYEESQEDGFSNAQYFRTLAQIEAARRPGEPVLLDPLLASVKSTGGGKASSSFVFLLALADIPYEPLPAVGPNGLPPDDGAGRSAGRRSDLVGALALLHRSTANQLDDVLLLEPLDGRRPNGRSSPSYRAYRIGAVEAGGPR